MGSGATALCTALRFALQGCAVSVFADGCVLGNTAGFFVHVAPSNYTLFGHDSLTAFSVTSSVTSYISSGILRSELLLVSHKFSFLSSILLMQFQFLRPLRMPFNFPLGQQALSQPRGACYPGPCTGWGRVRAGVVSVQRLACSPVQGPHCPPTAALQNANTRFPITPQSGKEGRSLVWPTIGRPSSFFLSANLSLLGRARTGPVWRMHVVRAGRTHGWP